MKRTLLLACCLAAPMMAQPADPLTATVTLRYETMRQNLIESAELMPEEGYAFKLTPQQRSFGDWIDHTSIGNMSLCSTIAGKAAPPMPQSPDSTKASRVAQLKASFAVCDAALKGTTDAKALTEITLNGKKVYPVSAMIGLVASLNEHYGNLVGYLRTKGLTPPSTTRAATKK